MTSQVRNYQPANQVVAAGETVMKILNRGGMLYAYDMELWEYGKRLYPVRFNVVDHLVKTGQIKLDTEGKRYITANNR